MGLSFQVNPPRSTTTDTGGSVMGLKKYEAVVNGHTTVLLLSDEDAAARGFTKAVGDYAEVVAPAAGDPVAKPVEEPKKPAARKRAPARKKAAGKPANKSATPAADKGA